MNPELVRNIWIECAPLRLAAAVLTPLLIFLLISSGGSWEESLFTAAHYVLLVAVAFWGARKAADAVAGELRDRTWDTQRLSGLGPVQMTIGKVLGAPSAVWVVVGVCVAAQAVAMLGGAGLDDGRSPLLFGFAVGWTAILAEVAGAFAVFAIAFFAALLSLNGQDRPRAFDATLFQFFSVAAGVGVLGVVSAATAAAMVAPGETFALFDRRSGGDYLLWWDVALPSTLALAVVFIAFGAWALYAGVHQMRRAFAMSTHAGAWLAFLAFLAVFFAGFAPERGLTLATMAVAVAAYAAALFEPHKLAVYRGWLGDLGRGRLLAALSAPAWLYAWSAASVLAVLAVAQGELAPLQWAHEFGGTEASVVVAAAILFALRDLGVCVWAGLRASDGRGLWAALLVLAVLYFLAPPLLALIADEQGAALFIPASPISIAAAAVQAGVIWMLVAREISAPVARPVASATA